MINESRDRPRRPAEKVVERKRLAALLAARAPQQIVVANGIFDLVHVGHARYFADARAAGDLLVVALNDDASATANKGAGRPLVPLEARRIVVAAFRSVDFVTWFPEATLGPTLRLLRPSLHAKGTDYSPGTLPADEREAHAELGIEVVIAGDPKDHATRDMIETIRSSVLHPGAKETPGDRIR